MHLIIFVLIVLCVIDASDSSPHCFKKVSIGERLVIYDVTRIIEKNTVNGCQEECNIYKCTYFSYGVSPNGNKTCELTTDREISRRQDSHFDLFERTEECAEGKPKGYEEACYRRIISGKRLHERFIRHSLPCNSLEACQHQCSIEKHFDCQGFNIRLDPARVGRGVCELSSFATSFLDFDRDFVLDPEFTYYERDRNNESPNCGHINQIHGIISSGDSYIGYQGSGGPYYGGDSYGPWSTGHGTVDHGPWGSHGYGSGFYQSNNPFRGPPPSSHPSPPAPFDPYTYAGGRPYLSYYPGAFPGPHSPENSRFRPGMSGPLYPQDSKRIPPNPIGIPFQGGSSGNQHSQGVSHSGGGIPGTQYPGGGSPGPQYPGGGSPGSQYPAGGSPGSQYPGGGSPGSQYPGGGSPGSQYPGGGSPGSQYPAGGSPGSQYPGGGSPGSQYPGGGSPGSQYPGGGSPGSQYPGGGSPGSKYPGGGSLGPQYPGGGSPGSQYPGGSSPGSPYPGGGSPGPQYPGGGSPGPQYPGGGSPGPQYPGGGSPGPQYPGGGSPGSQYPGGGSPGSQYPGGSLPGPQYSGGGSPGSQYLGGSLPGPQYPRGGSPGSQYPGGSLPGPQYPGGLPGPQYPGGGSPGSQYPGGGYPVSRYPGGGSPDRGYPGKDSPNSQYPGGVWSGSRYPLGLPGSQYPERGSNTIYSGQQYPSANFHGFQYGGGNSLYSFGGSRGTSSPGSFYFGEPFGSQYPRGSVPNVPKSGNLYPYNSEKVHPGSHNFYWGVGDTRYAGGFSYSNGHFNNLLPGKNSPDPINVGGTQLGQPTNYPFADRRYDRPNRIPTYIIIDADANRSKGGNFNNFQNTNIQPYRPNFGYLPPRQFFPHSLPTRPQSQPPQPLPAPPTFKPIHHLPSPDSSYGVAQNTIGHEICFRREYPGYKLNPSTIRGMYETPTVLECEAMCNKSPFKCTGYSFRYSTSDGGPNCLLTDFAALNRETHLLPDRSCDVYFKMETCVENDRISESECFLKVASSRKLDSTKVRQKVSVSGMADCELECLNSNLFTCRSFSFRHGPPVIGEPFENCYLSDWPTSALTHMDFVPQSSHEVYERGSFGHGCELDLGPFVHKPPFVPVSNVPQTTFHKDIWKIEETWQHFTVSGWPCRLGTECQLNPDAGFWSCEVEGGDRAQWDYCCKPKHSCGFSRGYQYPWCYVGEANPSQWRPCSERYYPDFNNRRPNKPVESNNPHPTDSFGPHSYKAPWNFGTEDFGPPSYWPISYFYSESPPNETNWLPEDYNDHRFAYYTEKECSDESPQIKFKSRGHKPYPRAIIQKIDLKNIPKAGNPGEQLLLDESPRHSKKIESSSEVFGFSPSNSQKENIKIQYELSSTKTPFFTNETIEFPSNSEKVQQNQKHLNKTKEIIKTVEKIILENSTPSTKEETNETLTNVESKYPKFFTLAQLEKDHFSDNDWI